MKPTSPNREEFASSLKGDGGSRIDPAQREYIESIARKFQKSERHPWMIDPRTSKRIGYVDVLTSTALIFTAIVTPFETALLDTELNALFVVNRVVDGIFAVDMILQFFTMVEMHAESTQGAQWLSHPGEVAKHYLQGWFLLDFFCIAISSLDIVAVLASTDILSEFAVLKTLRTLRLFKLVRLVKGSRIARRWEARLPINYPLMGIVGCVVQLLLTAHLSACVWLLQAFLQPQLSKTWIAQKGYCIDIASLPPGAPNPYPASFVSEEGFTCAPSNQMYIASLYWSVMTITSVGYGDIVPSLDNHVEQAVCTGLMLASCAVWAQLLGTYCGIVATLNPDRAAFVATMMSLNRFMSREAFPSAFRQRLREYFIHCKHLRLAEAQRGLLTFMPESLQGEVAWKTNQDWLRNIWFLKGASEHFQVQLAMVLDAMVYPPGDSPKAGYMYIIHRGVCLYQAKLLTKGKVFGEDIILSSAHLRSNAQARTMNYVEAYFCSRNDLLAISSRFPKTAAKIRTAAAKVALRRQVIMLARIEVGATPGDTLINAVKLYAARGGEGEDGTAPPVDDGKSLAEKLKEFNQEKAKETSEELPPDLAGGGGGPHVNKYATIVKHPPPSSPVAGNGGGGGGEHSFKAHGDAASGGGASGGLDESALMASMQRANDELKAELRADMASMAKRFDTMLNRLDKLAKEQSKAMSAAAGGFRSAQNSTTQVTCVTTTATPLSPEDAIQDGDWEASRDRPRRRRRHRDRPRAAALENPPSPTRQPPGSDPFRDDPFDVFAA